MSLPNFYFGQSTDISSTQGGGVDMDVSFLVSFLRERTGMTVGTDKRGLIENRLGPIAAREKLAGVGDLIRLLKADPDHPLCEDVIDAMTTHETFFFRDLEPFDHLRKVLLPALLNERIQRRTLRIWSAACSTGQEAYSLAMLLEEVFAANPSLGPIRSWKIEIVATDIGKRTLRRAKNGVYSRFEVSRGLSEALRARWFQPLEHGNWRVRDELKSRVVFKEHNLMESPSELGVFDLVLCRNLLIYFDLREKRQILSGLNSALAVDGRLMLGGAETLFGITPAFKREAGTTLPVYRKA